MAKIMKINHQKLKIMSNHTDLKQVGKYVYWEEVEFKEQSLRQKFLLKLAGKESRETQVV